MKNKTKNEITKEEFFKKMENLGLVYTNRERMYKALDEMHKALCAMDSGQIGIVRDHTIRQFMLDFSKQELLHDLEGEI